MSKSIKCDKKKTKKCEPFMHDFHLPFLQTNIKWILTMVFCSYVLPSKACRTVFSRSVLLAANKLFLYWDYIRSLSLRKLTSNCACLCSSLKPVGCKVFYLKQMTLKKCKLERRKDWWMQNSILVGRHAYDCVFCYFFWSYTTKKPQFSIISSLTLLFCAQVLVQWCFEGCFASSILHQWHSTG